MKTLGRKIVAIVSWANLPLVVNIKKEEIDDIIRLSNPELDENDFPESDSFESIFSGEKYILDVSNFSKEFDLASYLTTYIFNEYNDINGVYSSEIDNLLNVVNKLKEIDYVVVDCGEWSTTFVDELGYAKVIITKLNDLIDNWVDDIRLLTNERIDENEAMKLELDKATFEEVDKLLGL